MMEIDDNLLTINEYSRSGKKLKEVLAIVLHYTANSGASALANRNYFESRKLGKDGYGSAHYIVGLNGEVIRCVPDDEVAFHCGTSKLDPKSGKIYTDYAREKFGDYCLPTSSPNNCTIGIEMCNIDDNGHFSIETWQSTEQLVVKLLSDNNLKIENITTHEQIVGWKTCPLLFHNHPEEFERFKQETFLLV